MRTIAVDVVRLGHLVQRLILCLVHESLCILHDGRLVAESITDLLPLVLLVGLEYHVAWGSRSTFPMMYRRRRSHNCFEWSVPRKTLDLVMCHPVSCRRTLLPLLILKTEGGCSLHISSLILLELQIFAGLIFTLGRLLVDERVLKAGLHADPVSVFHPVSPRGRRLLFGLDVRGASPGSRVVLILRGRQMTRIGVSPTISVRP